MPNRQGSAKKKRRRELDAQRAGRASARSGQADAFPALCVSCASGLFTRLDDRRERVGLERGAAEGRPRGRGHGGADDRRVPGVRGGLSQSIMPRF